MARFAIKYAPLDVKIVDLYRTIAIKSRTFETTARIPITVVKISYDVIFVPTIPGKVSFNVPLVVFSGVIIFCFPFIFYFALKLLLNMCLLN